MIKKDLDLEHMFMLSEIIDKMDIEIDSLTGKIKTKKLGSKKDATELGKEIGVTVIADLLMKVISKIHKAKKEVMAFVAEMCEMTDEEVKGLKFGDLKKFFTELIKTDGVTDFLEQAVGETEK